MYIILTFSQKSGLSRNSDFLKMLVSLKKSQNSDFLSKSQYSDFSEYFKMLITLVPGLSFNLRIHVFVILSRMEVVLTSRALMLEEDFQDFPNRY